MQSANRKRTVIAAAVATALLLVMWLTMTQFGAEAQTTPDPTPESPTGDPWCPEESSSSSDTAVPTPVPALDDTTSCYHRYPSADGDSPVSDWTELNKEETGINNRQTRDTGAKSPVGKGAASTHLPGLPSLSQSAREEYCVSRPGGGVTCPYGLAPPPSTTTATSTATSTGSGTRDVSRTQHGSYGFAHAINYTQCTVHAANGKCSPNAPGVSHIYANLSTREAKLDSSYKDGVTTITSTKSS